MGPSYWPRQKMFWNFLPIWGQNKALVWLHRYSWTQIDVSIIFRMKFWSFSFFWFLCRPKNDRVRAFWKIIKFHESEWRRLEKALRSGFAPFCSRCRSDSWNIIIFQNALRVRVREGVRSRSSLSAERRLYGDWRLYFNPSPQYLITRV